MEQRRERDGLRALTKERWGVVLRITAASTVAGVVFSRFGGGTTLLSDLSGALSGFLLSFVLSSLETFGMRGRAGRVLRGRSLAMALVLRTLGYGAIILAGLAFVQWALRGAAGPGPSFLESTIFSVAASAFFNVVLTIRSLIGGPTLMALLSGRYHRPIEEERVVLFLDLVDSTALAERLGQKAFLRVLEQFVGAATEPIAEARGEIYRYVGDEIIVTWPVQRGAGIDPRCLGVIFAIDDAIHATADRWHREFGFIPGFRAALHAGRVVVGELGEIKREIMILGDTMNTAARIEDACRDLGRPYLASASVVERTTVPAGIRAESLGLVELRGKSERVLLFALARARESAATGFSAAAAGGC
jgi:adenylate cyclase